MWGKSLRTIPTKTQLMFSKVTSHCELSTELPYAMPPSAPAFPDDDYPTVELLSAVLLAGPCSAANRTKFQHPPQEQHQSQDEYKTLSTGKGVTPWCVKLPQEELTYSANTLTDSPFLASCSCK